MSVKILGVNLQEQQSAAIVENNRVRAGFIGDDAISLANQSSLFDTVVSWDKRVKNQFKLKNFELVDYRQSLVAAAVATRGWNNCAVIMLDSIYTGLGYWTDSMVHWLSEFEYPNSLALFYSAATRLLGYDPATEEHRVRALALRGRPVFSDWILDNLVQKTEKGYQLLHNLEYGVGSTYASPDIACSVQEVYKTILLHLANWLSSQTTLTRLVVVGRGAANFVTNSALLDSDFTDIAFSPKSGAASTAIGAACLLGNASWKNICIGTDAGHSCSTEQMVDQLLKTNSLVYCADKQEFADTNILNRNMLKLPTKQALQNVSLDSVFLCTQEAYSSYFTSKSEHHTGHILSNCAIPWFPKQVRVFTVSSSSSAYLTRVLNLLAAEQQPIIISEPL